MTQYGAVFYLLSAIIVVATGMAVTRRQPVHAVLYLIVAFLGQQPSSSCSGRPCWPPSW